MPSVGSTPTTSSPAQQQQQPQSNQTRYFTTSAQTVATTPSPSSVQHVKLQQQHSLPLQLQYQVTTTQPSSAGIFISQTAGIISSTTTLGNYIGRRATNTSSNSFNTNGGDISPASSSGSFSSADTNKTMLNAIVNHQNNQQRPHTNKSSAALSRNGSNNNNNGSLPMGRGGGGGRHTTSQSRAYRTKYSQFMIITPAVSIDRNFKRTTIITTHQNNSAENHAFNAAADDDYDDDDDDAHFSNNNGNVYRASMRQSSIDSGNSSDSVGSFRSNYNPYLHTSRQHLLPKSSPAFCVFSPSSWGWCTFLCAAMRCFGSGGNSGGAHNSRSHYSSSFVRPLFQRSRSSGVHTNVTPSKAPHRRLRSYSTASFTPETAFEHFSAPFKHRKARDPLNNITYEL